MSNKKTDIIPYNEKGQQHGYWECYWHNGQFFKGNFINDELIGYCEWGWGKKKFYLI